MAYATEHRYSRSLDLAVRLSVLLSALASLTASWAAYRRARAELETLSDRELDDLDIGRSAMAEIAEQAAAASR